MFPTEVCLNEGYAGYGACARLRPVCGDSSWEDVWCVNMNRGGVCVHVSCLLAAQENGFRPLNRIKVSQLRHEGSLLLHHIQTVTHIYIFTHASNRSQTFPQETLSARLCRVSMARTPLSHCVNADHVITGSFCGPLVDHMYVCIQNNMVTFTMCYII